MKIIKRDGRKVNFNQHNIEAAIYKCLNEVNPNRDNLYLANGLTKHVVKEYTNKDESNVEDIQDYIETLLMKSGFTDEAKAYILYRENRSKARAYKSSLTTTIRDILQKSAEENELLRENANQNGNGICGRMFRISGEAVKDFAKKYVMRPEQARAHTQGWIHIHDMDFYGTGTFNCLQIPAGKLLKKGFNTGNGFLRQPNSVLSASMLMCIILQSNQNDMYGGQSIPTFEYDLAPYVVRSYIKHIQELVKLVCRNNSIDVKPIREYIFSIYDENDVFSSAVSQEKLIGKFLYNYYHLKDTDIDYILDEAKVLLDKETHQAMQAMIHNLNTMECRSGSQTVFSSLNYGTGITYEQRLVIKCVLDATEEGLGHGETPIFPVQIFKVKDEVNTKPNDPNYDLFIRACEVSAKRLFPNFEYLDQPYNISAYVKGKPETELATMGCRTRVLQCELWPDHSQVSGRGNLSFTTINLPRLGIEAKGDLNKFYKMLDDEMQLVKQQLADRFESSACKKVYNFPFLMGQHIYDGSDDFEMTSEIREAIKYGTVSIGFIGLAECLIALTGKHHGESEKSRLLGLEIIKHMNKKCHEFTKEMQLNYSLFATPAEGLSSRFTRLDKKKYGIIPGITDKEFYTNSCHVPVYYNIEATRKMEIEGEFAQYLTAGSITYVEFDGDPAKNLDAFIDLVMYAKDCGINYFAINHDLDRCPICGFNGIIDGDTCPNCGWKEGTEIDLDDLHKRGIYPKIE